MSSQSGSGGAGRTDAARTAPASGAQRDDPLASAVIATVPNVMRHLLSHARRRPSWVDMTYQQYNVLLTASEGELSQAEIARRLMVTAPVITRLVSALVEAGLVERGEDPTDRRSVRLTLTDAGRKRVEAMRHELVEAAREFVEPIPEKQRAALADALDQLQILTPGRTPHR